MRHLTAVNSKAGRVVRATAPVESPQGDVVALQGGGGAGGGGGAPPQQQPPQAHIPLGCTLMFSPGWEADRTGGTAGLCQPVERDLFDCHLGCFWPAQVPDQLNHSPKWTNTCAT